MRFRNSLMAVFFAVPFAVACGSDCHDVCEDMVSEGCNDFDNGQCEHLCVDYDDFVEEDDKCEAKMEDYVDCVMELDDICDALYDPDKPTVEEECRDEASEYAECLGDYCADHPNKDWCTGSAQPAG
jgi:hypothetical protein